jgi:hypothetical protein
VLNVSGYRGDGRRYNEYLKHDADVKETVELIHRLTPEGTPLQHLMVKCEACKRR